MIADFAIWRPKLDETVVAPGAGGMGRRGLERELRAALEVDAEVESLEDQRAGPEQDDRTGDGEPEIALAHEVDLQPPRGLLALGAHEARVVEPGEAAEQAEHRARGADRGDQRDHRAD